VDLAEAPHTGTAGSLAFVGQRVLPSQQVGASSRKPAVLWENCATELAQNHPSAQCATFALPLDPALPDATQLPVHVQKIPARGVRRGQLWLLAGGPGGAGSDMAWFAEAMSFLDTGLDVMVPDHRGTGGSARLACPAEEAISSEGSRSITAGEWPSCLASLADVWGGDLRHFTTTAAAHDLRALLAATREPGDLVYVYGVSYGTYWAQRWLHLDPAGADGVILDSVCPAQGCTVAQYDAQFDTAAGDLLDLCAGDAECAQQLGDQPEKRARDILDRLDAGHCPALAPLGVDRKRVRNILGVLLTVWELRTYLPAILHRIDRCEPADIEALGVLASLFAPPAAGLAMEPSRRSLPLGNHILLSEMYADGPGPSPGALQAASEQAIASLDAVAPLAQLHGGWPRYRPDDLVGTFPQTQVPMLLLAGTLDPQTPLAFAQAAAARFRAPNQRLIILPGAAHGTVVASPVQSSDQDCGLQLTLGFLQAPTQAPDLSCIDDLKPVDFQGEMLVSMALFGTPDTWSPTWPDAAAAANARAASPRMMQRLRAAIAEQESRGER